MIGFGELHKRSLEWRTDLSTVERAYATDWLLKSIFDDSILAGALLLRGSSALRYAYSAQYPVDQPPELLASAQMEAQSLQEALTGSISKPGEARTGLSGLQFSLTHMERGTAKIEYNGPLGRRSAAQPHIVLSLISGRSRYEPVRVPLVHPFSDACPATVTAVALEELIGERLALLVSGPRARDLFDLWFAATQVSRAVEWSRARELAAQIAQERNITAGTELRLDPAHRAALERTWDAALKRAPRHPSLAQVEQDLAAILQQTG